MTTAFHQQIGKASVLIEALPYMQQFRGQTFVIKIGGSAMDDWSLIEGLLRDVVFLEGIGINPVLVHGGGKAISKGMSEAGLEARFVNGLRVTDDAAIGIVEKVLTQDINPRLVRAMNDFGGLAVGINGKRVFLGKKSAPVVDKASGALADLGWVGDDYFGVGEGWVLGCSEGWWLSRSGCLGWARGDCLG